MNFTSRNTSKYKQKLSLLALATAMTAGYTGQAFAQSNTVGSVFGQATAQAGAQVLLENLATGLKRTVSVEANGRFQIGALPPGQYRVSLQKDGKQLSVVTVEVRAGQGVEAAFITAATQLERVEVSGRVKSLDVSNAENGSTFMAKQLAILPIATQDLNGIISLAANTTQADSRYAGGVSIGGGAPSENSYYINGMPVTNALTQLGSIELPFSAIAQADVKTGGFGAEFGRSVGGVMSVTTKSGTNKWQGEVGFSIEPNALRSKPRNAYYPNTGATANAATDGSIYFDRSHNTRNRFLMGASVGGPIVKDKLFFFLAADYTKTDLALINRTPQSAQLDSSGWNDEVDKNKRYLAKFDWLISDDHQLELTLLGDTYESSFKYSPYNYSTGQHGDVVYSENAKNLASVTPAVGGEAQIIKYTGRLAKDLVLTALYGQASSKHEDKFSFSPDTPTFGWTTTGRNPNYTYISPAKTTNPLPFASTISPDGAQEKTKSFRLDVEYKLGNHLLRAGIDDNRLSSVNAGDVVAGGSSWQYASTTNSAFKGFGGTTNLGTLTSAVNGRYYYARRYILNTATGAESNQAAQYIEDQFQVTNNLLLTLGLRNESFVNKNGDGETFLESKNFKSPRLAAVWDVMGDASLKLYGSAGRYSLQIPTHVAVRGASRSLYTNQYFAYTGVDQVTGLPLGLTPTGPAASVNNEYGQPKDVKAVSAQGIKPTYQDELTLGIEKALTPKYTGGAKVTYRQLKETIDDTCDDRPFFQYAADNSIDDSNYGGFNCASFNPGKGNRFLVDYAGNGTYTDVYLTADQLGFAKPKRTYIALDFFVEHRLSDGWYGKLAYTYSRSKGNTEGQTKSDNAQTDVAATSTWDNPELMEGAYGFLPNDRTHQIKFNGSYELADGLTLGANFLAESGRPKNCFGNYGGTSTTFASYGSVYFYCAGESNPRGTLGRLPWSTKLDLNAIYKPTSLAGLSFRLDVFNIFNSQSIRVVDEIREVNNDASSVLPTYGRVINYSAPRAVRLTVNYSF